MPQAQSRLTAALGLVGLSLSATVASADVSIAFDEGAPKDRFMIVYTGDCPLGPTDVIVDLEGSDGALIFDVAEGGAGVEVFQPIEVILGSEDIAGISEIRDGDRSVTIRFDRMMPMQHAAFTVDVDDSAGSRPTVVSGAEIRGAKARVAQSGAGVLEATFDETSRALVRVPGCMS
ncbi:MAG: aggregation factor core [Pseudomonadota bacterium]